MTPTDTVFALPDQILRDAVRTERKNRRWDQTQLAARLREMTATWPSPLTMDQNTITRIETGHRGISLNEAYALCVVLDLDLGELLGMSGTPEFLKAVRDRRAAASQILDIVESVLGPIRPPS